MHIDCRRCLNYNAYREMKYLVPKLFFLLFCLISIGSYADQISVDKLKALKICPASNDVTTRFQTFLTKVHEKVKKEKKVYFWELEDRNTRNPHYCIDECGCMADEYVAALNTCSGVEVAGLRVNGIGLLPVEIKHTTWDSGKKTNYNHAYQTHVATLIHFMNSDCYAITDPIMNERELLSPADWLNNIPSLQKNTIFTWKR